MTRTNALGFLTGFVAVLVCHRGSAFHVGNGIPALVGIFGTTPAPYDKAPIPPPGVPTVPPKAFRGAVLDRRIAPQGQGRNA